VSRANSGLTADHADTFCKLTDDQREVCLAIISAELTPAGERALHQLVEGCAYTTMVIRGLASFMRRWGAEPEAELLELMARRFAVAEARLV
jgi:hypothetical protein